MAATIVNKRGDIAKIEHDEWSCNSDETLGIIQAVMVGYIPEAYTPDEDLAKATYVAGRLGFDVTSHDKIEHVDGRVY